MSGVHSKESLTEPLLFLQVNTKLEGSEKETERERDVRRVVRVICLQDVFVFSHRDQRQKKKQNKASFSKGRKIKPVRGHTSDLVLLATVKVTVAKHKTEFQRSDIMA